MTSNIGMIKKTSRQRNIVTDVGNEPGLQPNEMNLMCENAWIYISAFASLYIVCTQQPSVNDKEIFNKRQRIKMKFCGKGFISLAFGFASLYVLYVLRTKELDLAQ